MVQSGDFSYFSFTALTLFFKSSNPPETSLVVALATRSGAECMKGGQEQSRSYTSIWSDRYPEHVSYFLS